MSKIRPILILILSGILGLFAQPNRITGRIAGTRRVLLTGNVHPRATAANDQGPVDPGLTLPHVTLMLQPSAAQKAGLEQLLAEQQDPSSPNYHKWLTPEQYADRFGISQSDINKIEAWVKSQNLTVLGVARGRDWIAVSGTAGAVENAFGTQIHHYLVNGELHFANASEPSIPAALQGIVASIHGLNNFRLKPASRPRGAALPAGQPQYNAGFCGGHCLAPDDVATIYNITPLFTPKTDGGKIAIAGQTQIRLTDIEQFRSFFGLPANDPQVILVPNTPDPGISTTGDLSEADLDVEMAGAVARNASIIYVYAADVTTAEQYAIDQNLAPVLSTSYGDCEANFMPSEVAFVQGMAQRAISQGMTWFGASGDSGATDCAGDGVASLTNVASVDLPAGLPQVTGIGGTEFNDPPTSPVKYWSTTNSSTNASALSYIPETGWNDTAIDGSPSASGGGASKVFSKPSWQTGTGVPNDGARDVPDISISASADHDGYLIFTSDPGACGTSAGATPATCKAIFGGTSVGAPLYSGLAGLLNQWVVSQGAQASAGLGNINPMLYSLARTSPGAFHDVTTGDNIIKTPAGPVGYTAGPGYDLVTGLGSVDAAALFTAWVASSAHTTPPGAPSISGITNAASYAQVFAPGMILSVFGSQLAPSTQAASSVPLPMTLAGVTATINGIGAPLWYVSSGQINLQVPYEIPTGTNVTLAVNNNGQTATTSFILGSVAPGIFTDSLGETVPFTSAARGQIITMYMTGVGAVSPGVLDGAAPANGTPLASLPAPVQPTTVTVGGVAAPTPLAFVGIPWGLVGVVQINFQVPTNAPLGPQPVVVTVGSGSSKAATLTVTQ